MTKNSEPRSKGKLVLGLDVGLKSTGAVLARVNAEHKSGYSILKVATVVTNVDKKKSIKQGGDWHQNELYASRCKELFNGLMEFTDEGRDLSAVVAEMPTGGGQNAVALAMMMAALGTVASFTTVIRTPLVVIQPAATKSKLCGNLSASKKDIETAVRAIFNDYVWPKLPASRLEHIMDAAGALVVGRESDIYMLLSKGLK